MIALPVDGPAARLCTDGIRGVAGDQNFCVRIQRQGAVIVLEQHEGFAHRLARQRTMSRTAEQREIARVAALFGRRPLEQSGDGLDAQNAPHGIVDASLRNLAGPRLAQRVLVQLPPTVRRHQHVDAGEYRGRAPELGAARNLFVGVPVAHHEPAEGHPPLQDIRQQIVIAVQLDAIPAVIGRHDDQCAGVDRRGVPCAVHRTEFRFIRCRCRLF